MSGYEEPGGAPADPEPSPDAMTVEVGGTSRRLPAEHDYTGDGLPDAAVETAEGTVVVFADTEDNETGAPGPDGRADEAYVIDKRTGQVVSAAHLDPGSGSWVSTDGEPVNVPDAGGWPAVEPGPAVEQTPTDAGDAPAAPDPDGVGGAREARAD